MQYFAIPGLIREPYIDKPKDLKRLVSMLEIHYNMPKGTITRKSRAGYAVKRYATISLSLLRTAIVYFSRVKNGFKLMEIAEILHIDHTSVIYHERTGKSLLEFKDKRFVDYYDTLLFVLKEMISISKKETASLTA